MRNTPKFSSVLMSFALASCAPTLPIVKSDSTLTLPPNFPVADDVTMGAPRTRRSAGDRPVASLRPRSNVGGVDRPGAQGQSGTQDRRARDQHLLQRRDGAPRGIPPAGRPQGQHRRRADRTVQHRGRQRSDHLEPRRHHHRLGTRRVGSTAQGRPVGALPLLGQRRGPQSGGHQLGGRSDQDLLRAFGARQSPGHRRIVRPDPDQDPQHGADAKRGRSHDLARGEALRGRNPRQRGPALRPPPADHGGRKSLEPTARTVPADHRARTYGAGQIQLRQATRRGAHQTFGQPTRPRPAPNSRSRPRSWTSARPANAFTRPSASRAESATNTSTRSTSSNPRPRCSTTWPRG